VEALSVDEKQLPTPQAPLKRKKISNRKLQDYSWAYLMVAPTVIGLCILNLWPIVQTAYISLTRSNGFGAATFVGLNNYQSMFTDPQVLQATINTLIYTAISAPLGIFISLIVAVLMNTKIRGKSLYRTIFFLPVVATPAAVAMVWRWLLDYKYGIVNYVLSRVGISGPNWIGDSNYVMTTIVIVGIWSMLGYNMIILLAGLQEIPETYYEAADIDGAGPIRKFFSITVPLLSPTMFFVTVTTMIGSLQVFDYIYMMVDKGNPALPNAISLVYLFYRYSFVDYNQGYGSAIVMLLLVIILIITLIQLKLQKKWVHYES
jgi:multiple sugar transport system permease protein